MALTTEQNERLTRVGPGTPMGNLLRRYWHVVGTRDELDREPVRPVKLLGEELTLYRDAKGTLGLIGNRCAHRAISLACGIPQDVARLADYALLAAAGMHVTSIDAVAVEAAYEEIAWPAPEAAY